MQSDQREPGQHILKMAHEGIAYAKGLLDENSRLLEMLAFVGEETERLKCHLASMRRVLDDNGELREQKQIVETDRKDLESSLADARRELDNHEHRVTELHNRMQALEAENRRYSEQFGLLEQQNTALANLYVAAHRLNGTARLQEVVRALQEIIANLIGSEEMAIFEVDESGSSLELIGSMGINPDMYRTIPLGKGLIGQAARDGEKYISSAAIHRERLPAERNLTACIPLKLDGEVIGLIALFRLLPQKHALQAIDLELFDLLSSQAATSLYCTSVRRMSGRFPAERPTAAGPR